MAKRVTFKWRGSTWHEGQLYQWEAHQIVELPDALLVRLDGWQEVPEPEPEEPAAEEEPQPKKAKTRSSRKKK